LAFVDYFLCMGPWKGAS